MCLACDFSRRRVLGLGLGLAAAGAFAPRRARADSPVAADKPLIMLDPGHGGMDPGTTAADGAEEKWITLYSANALREALQKTKRYRVGMTRTRDIYVPLPDRVADAVSADAALFL